MMKDKLQERLTVLRTLRDEIRLDLHLASMGLRDEWKELERKLPAPGQTASQVKGATAKTLDKLAGELKKFRSRIRKGRHAGVQRIMTRTAAICRASDSLADAVTAMWQCDVGFLPVVGDGGVVRGVITDRDAAIAACTRGRRMDEVPVEAVMSKDFASCTEHDEIADALTIMRARRVRRLPVLDQAGRLAGIVTLADAARAVGRPGGRRAEANGHDARDVVLTLTVITEPGGRVPSAPGN